MSTGAPVKKGPGLKDFGGTAPYLVVGVLTSGDFQSKIAATASRQPTTAGSASAVAPRA